jgi:hypothetical protein
MRVKRNSSCVTIRVLNGELSTIFKRWYPDMDLEVEEMPVAA